jgi:predicted amidohydrolase YtcJ
MQIDLIINNANVLSQHTAQPLARTIGIHHGRVVALGADLEGLKAARTIDAGGATVVPGFNDVHCHTAWYGMTLAEVDLSDISDLDKAYRMIAQRATGTPEDEWVFATGYNPQSFGGRFPSLATLDTITGGHPLLIRQSSGHAALANTAALRFAGVFSPGFVDPVGGVVERDAAGHPTGRLEETAQNLVMDLVRPYKGADLGAAIDRATRKYASQGITSFTEAGIGDGWIGHSPIELAAYQNAHANGQLHARAQLMPTLDTFGALSGHVDDGTGLGLSLGLRTGFGDDWLSLGPVKLFVDGSLTGETAAMTECYCGNEQNRGYFQDEPDLIRDRILAAASAGWSVAAHAIGDSAIDLAISAITEAQKLHGRPAVPHRIEHATYVREDQMPRLAAANIVVTPQPMFVHTFGDAFEHSLGVQRCQSVYRARSFLDAGIILPGSSDRPCIEGNPLHAMRTMIQRQTSSGRPFGNPYERLSSSQALHAYTVAAGQATGFGDRKGKLAPGYLADLVFLDRNPLDTAADELPDIRVLTTMVGGETVYTA